MSTPVDSPRTLEIEGFTDIQIVDVRGKRVLARAKRISDGCKCFLNVDGLAKLTAEWAMLEKIGPHQGLLQGLALAKTSLGPVLVTKFIPGVLLSEHRLISDPKQISREELRQFCRVAARVCEALGWVHKADMVHRNVSDSKLMYDPETGEVTLIGCGMACSTSIELKPSVSACKYVSPEQTGRTSLPVDGRSDLYSLGAVLYEIAAGHPLFSGQDALGTIYQHLTSEPVPLHEVCGIPVMLSGVIMKLLEKHPDNRYQSAWGAMFDFRKCLAQLERLGVTAMPNFELGTKDISTILCRPTALYGREKVMNTLRGLLDDVKEHGLRIALISGPSGSGKTSVAKELQRGMSRHAWLGSKLDQCTRVPYACFIPIFEQIVDRILTLDPNSFCAFRERARQKLDGRGQLLLNSFPVLNLVLGQQDLPSAPGPVEEKNIFLKACQDFFSLIPEQGQPLVMFFDDMQWADEASWVLLQTVCELRELPLLILCAHRTNDAPTPCQPAGMARLAESGSPVTLITVENLTQAQISAMLNDTFQGRCSMVNEIASYLFKSTLGNPFFMAQLLDALYQQKSIEFELTAEGGEWVWKAGVVATDNVLELLVAKIKTLPTRNQEVLRTAALVGATFDSRTMHALTQTSLEQIHADLAILVDMGLIVEQGAMSRAAMLTTQNTETTRTFRFLHDRVQQAAMCLFSSEEERTKAHYSLGYLMWEGKLAKDQKVFEIANQMLEGVRFVTPEQRLEVCELFLQAGKQAREGMSSGHARKYLRAINDLIPPTDEAWVAHKSLMRRSFFEQYEVAFQLGEQSDAKAHLEAILAHSDSVIEKAEVLDKMAAVSVVGENLTGLVQAYHYCVEALAMFGVQVPTDNQEQALEAEYRLFRQTLEEKKIEDLRDLLDLPRLDTPEKDCIARAFKSAMVPLYLSNPGGLRLVSAMCVNWSIRNGISAYMCYPYGMFSMVLVWHFHDIKLGESLAMASLQLNDRIGAAADQYRACLVVGACIFNWTRSHTEAEMVITQAQTMAVARGDYVFSSYAYFCRALQFFIRPTLQADLDLYDELLLSIQRHGQIANSNAVIISCKLGNMCLQGKSKSPFSLAVAGLVDDVEAWIAQHWAETRAMALISFYVTQALTQFIMFDYKGAFDSIVRVTPLMPFMAGCQLNAVFWFLQALTCLQLISPSNLGTCKTRPLQPGPCAEEEIAGYMATVDECLCNFAMWANGPRTYYQMLLIVYAEKRRVMCARESASQLDLKKFRDPVLKKKDKSDLYRMAIASATETGTLMHAAMAHELAMRYWQTQNEVEYAKVHWRGAMVAYHSWGARAKVALLQEEFAYSNLSRTLDAPLTDPISALLYKKQAICTTARLLQSEIMLDKLLVNLMNVIAEHVGATFGLLLCHEQEWKVECTFGTHVRDCLPITILNFVYRKHESLVIDDLATHELFYDDPYVAKYGPKSALCVPIVLHGDFISAIYLENNEFAGTFTADSCEIAEILGSQAATGIQNGRLYRQLNDYNRSLEEQVRERTRQLSTAREHAEQANKAKSTFLASMSHEIRTPMNGIMASMELLKMSRLTDEQTELADVVITCSDALLVLINDILDLSKIEADKLELESVWFNLQRCLESVLDILAPKAFPKSLDIEFQAWGLPGEQIEVVVRGQKRTFFSNVPKVIRGDYTRFRQIVVNLCNNAVKFTHSGEVSVKVWWRPLEGGKDGLGQPVELYFSVVDTGIGIPASRLPMLFKAFSQVENSTTRKYGGTGLGLAICQSLVQLMGGTIWVDTEEGKGSNFQFTMNTSSHDPKAVSCVNMVTDQSEKKPSLRPGLRVLLVEDPSTCADIFVASMAQFGCVCTRVAIKDGLAALQNYEHDVCLVDWAPKSDEQPSIVSGEEELHPVKIKQGERLIECFRAWEATQPHHVRVPIVLVSFDRQHKLGSLIDGFIVKPIKQRHMLKVFDAVTSAVAPVFRLHLNRGDSMQLSKPIPLKLMMAEDNKINVRLAVKMVESVGYQMTIVNNGQQALDQVRAWYHEGTPCQVLLMDVQMPVMDGLEATAQIRKSEIPTSDQPYIIALTANAMSSDRLLCLQAGMDDYLSKPLSRQDLARALRMAARAKGVAVSDVMPYEGSP